MMKICSVKTLEYEGKTVKLQVGVFVFVRSARSYVALLSPSAKVAAMVRAHLASRPRVQLRSLAGQAFHAWLPFSRCSTWQMRDQSSANTEGSCAFLIYVILKVTTFGAKLLARSKSLCYYITGQEK